MLKLFIGCLLIFHFLLPAILFPLNSTTITVGIDNQYPPYEYVSQGKQPIGFDIDVIKSCARESGLSLKFISGDWGEIREKFDKGELDILAGFARTPVRERKYLFTTPYAYLHFGIFIRKGNPPLNSWNDLRDKSVIVRIQGVMEEILREKKVSAAILLTRNNYEALEKLANGVADAVLLPRIQGYIFIKEHGLDNLTDTGNLGAPIPYCMAVSKNNPQLLKTLDTALEQLRASGKIREIKNNWFGIYDTEENPYSAYKKWFERSLFILLFTICAIVISYYLMGRKIFRQKKALLHQIEQRVHTEKEITRLHQLFEMGPIVFLKWNDTNREIFEYISDNIANFGYNPEDILSNRILFRSIIHPDDLGWVLKDRESHLKSNSFNYWQIYRIISPHLPEDNIETATVNVWKDRNLSLTNSGMVQIRWIYDYTIVIPDEQASCNNFYGYLLNITAQKRNELEMRKEHQDAHAAIFAKDTFLSSMTNEINTPLNALIGLVRKLTGMNYDREQQLALRTIINSAIHLRQVTSQIHDYVSTLKGNVGPQKQWYRIDELLSLTIPEYQIKLADKPIAFEHSEYFPQASVLIDRLIFQKIVCKILDNAIKFSSEGRISIAVDLEGNDEAKRTLVVMVSDTGVGIPREKLQTIMEPFNQADTSFTRRFGGIGLGLSIAQNLLLQLSGKIDIRSELGKGTTVTLSFPVEINLPTLQVL